MARRCRRPPAVPARKDQAPRVIGREEPRHVDQHCEGAGWPAKGLTFAGKPLALLIRHLQRLRAADRP